VFVNGTLIWHGPPLCNLFQTLALRIGGLWAARLRRDFFRTRRRNPNPQARSTMLHKMLGRDVFLCAVRQTRSQGRGLCGQALRPALSPSSLDTAATAAIARSMRVANWPMSTARRSIGSNDTLPVERRVQVQR